jgi:EmrB/QacA subfamily drug resistance transporter
MTAPAEPGTVGTSSPASAFQWHKAAWIALAVLCLAQLVDTVDVTIVNVTLPAIKNSLGFSETSLQWVVNAYTVFYGGFILLGGRVGDLAGRRRVFTISVAVFTVASLASGLAPDAGSLIASRSVQGLAAAFMSPATLAILASTFPEGVARNKAVAIWGTVSGVGGALGVVFGGLLTSGPGWRWIFFINVPIGAAILILSPLCLPPDRPRRGARRFDLTGAVTATGGAGLLAYALVENGSVLWRMILVVAALLLIVTFAVTESRAADPLVPFSMFRNRAVAGANIVAPLIGASTFAMFFFISLYEQQVLGYSALRTAVVYLPLTGAFIIGSALSPQIVPKWGIRAGLVTGSALGAIGLVLLARLKPDVNIGISVILPSFIIGIGLGLTFVPLSLASVSRVERGATGLASGLMNATRLVGGAVGLALIVGIAIDRASHLLPGHSLTRAADLLSAAHLSAASKTALVSGFHFGFLVAAVLLGVAAVTAAVVFRQEGRGEAVNMMEIMNASMEKPDSTTNS